MPLTTDSEEVPVRIVGSSVYGIYPTVSVERTYNMYVSSSGDGEEEWLINFPGYAAILALIQAGGVGRGIFRSTRGGFLLAVVNGEVFRINALSSAATSIGVISSSNNEVFFAENLSSQICFCSQDDNNAYIYNYAAADTAIGHVVYDAQTSSFQPNYVCYHNTYFIFGNSLTTSDGSKWLVYQSGYLNTLATAYNLNWVQTLALQTKSDFAKAVIPIPGSGNNVLVFGSTVAEIWNNVGGLPVYQRNASINIDYGIESVATIAANDEVVAWLGVNEKSSPALMQMQGGQAQRISSDGLDHLLETVLHPEDSTAILFRQGGHLFYILTFFNAADNFTIMYDFTTKRLYDLLDWDSSYFPARQIVYFDHKNYFISLKDGAIYEISSELTQFDVYAQEDGAQVDNVYQMPCIRLTNTHRIANRPEKYKIKLLTFTVESGTTPEAYKIEQCYGYILMQDGISIIYTEDGLPLLVQDGYCSTNKPRVDLTISKNGGYTFSNTVSYDLKETGNYQNQPRFNNLGYAQQITYHLSFWGNGRKVVKNGTMEVSG